MICVELVSLRNRGLIPSIGSSLVSTNKQHRVSFGIESVKHAVRPAFMLDSQFPHMGILRLMNTRTIWKNKRWTCIFQ